MSRLSSIFFSILILSGDWYTHKHNQHSNSLITTYYIHIHTLHTLHTLDTLNTPHILLTLDTLVTLLTPISLLIYLLNLYTNQSTNTYIT